MNSARGFFSILIFCGAAAAQSTEASYQPFFDLPLFLADTPTAVQNQADTPSATEEIAPSSPAAAEAPGQHIDKRAFGVLPNYRTADSRFPFQRITTKQKFTIATKDSFDWPVLFNTAFFAGLSQVQGDNNEVYGQGVKGFAHRYGISYADQVIGNFFPEAIVPTLLHMDPRYYRKGTGSVKSRLGYAIVHIFISRNDNGHTTFNYPEILGNAMASGVALSYHIHERTFGDFAYQWGFTYVTSDAIGQVLKEFWPDVKHKLFQKHAAATP
jgi:hypothetical protein